MTAVLVDHRQDTRYYALILWHWVDELDLERAECRLVVDFNDLVRPTASGQQSKNYPRPTDASAISRCR